MKLNYRRILQLNISKKTKEIKMKQAKKKHAGLKVLGIVAITIGLSWLYLWYFESVRMVILFKNPDEVFLGLPLELRLPSRIYDFIVVAVFLFIINRLLKYRNVPKYKTEEIFISSLMGIFLGLIIATLFMSNGLVGIKTVLRFQIIFVSIAGILFGVIKERKTALTLNLSFGIFDSLILWLGIIVKTGIALGLMAGFIIFAQILITGSVAIIIGNFLFKKVWDRFTSYK